MISKIRDQLRVRSADKAFEDAVHDYQNVYLKLVARLEGLLGSTQLLESKVLELGCGYTCPNVALLSAAGVNVCGADVEAVFFRDGRLATFRQRLREVGFAHAIDWAGPRYTGCQHFFAALAVLAHASFDHKALTLCTYDGHRLPFADESFDAVCSNAVLEHVGDLPAFVSETARVLRPGGVVDMLWHNFYSPSGGHRFASDVARSPWGHVTGESPPSCFLNRKRPDEIRHEFAKRLTERRVIGVSRDNSLQDEISFMPEGEDELSDEWRRKLPGLPDYLLTTRAYLIQAVKDA
jgi:SAM-dependent methyltransferase